MMVLKRDVVLAIGSYLLLMALAAKFSLMDGLGQDESAHLATSIWMYARRIIMILFACVLPLLCGQEGIAAYGWRVTPRWLAIAVGLGILIGFRNPGGFDPLSVVAIVLAAFHTFATELYFRAFLITTFARHCKGFWTPIVLSSVMYGLSYLTVYNIWFHQWPYFKIVGAVLFTAIGLLMGYCYRKSQSFPVPWTMHFFGVLKYGMLF
jgi:membrane protease YdiL (CAAX protease family)